MLASAHFAISYHVDLNRAMRALAAALHSASVGRRRPVFGVFICQFVVLVAGIVPTSVVGTNEAVR